MHPGMSVETTHVTEFEYTSYFACTRKDVRLVEKSKKIREVYNTFHRIAGKPLSGRILRNVACEVWSPT